MDAPTMHEASSTRNPFRQKNTLLNGDVAVCGFTELREEENREADMKGYHEQRVTFQSEKRSDFYPGR